MNGLNTGHRKDPITGVPIIGTGRPVEINAEGLTANCEIYDTEIIAIQEVLEAMKKRGEQGGTDFGMWDAECQDRFAKIGFKVVINWYRTNVEGVLIPEITISDRTERHDFDHDRQVAEVTGDVLGFGEGGVIKTDPSMLGQEHKH